MEREIFKKVDEFTGKIYEKFWELYESGAFKEWEKELKKICSELPEKYSMAITMGLDITDSEREKTIMLESTGIACFSGHEPYKIEGSSSTPDTYIVKGNICKVPHNYCPGCWGEWDFKVMHPVCPECGIEMGKDVKLLLDTNVCPHCDEGNVSRSKPTCDQCGYKVDENIITWG